mmetsp:Transcript_21257/g.31283  ORF Transcript_21257/g.31283 Transcript_21257/m.31283 type:complete len:90 (+) Transcript_21257:98-367(+)
MFNDKKCHCIVHLLDLSDANKDGNNEFFVSKKITQFLLHYHGHDKNTSKRSMCVLLEIISSCNIYIFLCYCCVQNACSIKKSHLAFRCE